MEAPLYPDFPFGPSTPYGSLPACWVGPRYLAGDDGRPYDVVADTLAGLGWTGLTAVRGRQEPDEAPEDRREVLRSTVLHISPDALCWAQWTLADEPVRLGGLPIAWHISAREDTATPSASWSAYFTADVPGEVLVDFLVALDASSQPVAPLAGPEAVLDAVVAHGWLRDIDRPLEATDPTCTTHIGLREMPSLIQDADPRALLADTFEAGPEGWQAWAEPLLGAPCLWAASFGASAPHDLVAVFAASLSSTVPVLRQVLPEATQGYLLRAPAV